MSITAAQVWNNFFAIVIMALVIEVAVSSIFSIKYLEDVLQSTMGKSVRTILIILIAAGLCSNIDGLRVFAGMKILKAKGWQNIAHIAITTLIIARVAGLFTSWFAHIKQRTSQM